MWWDVLWKARDFFEACLSRLFRSFMVLGVESLKTTSCSADSPLGLYLDVKYPTVKVCPYLACRRNLAPLSPQNNIIFGIRQLKEIFRTFRPKKNEIVPFLSSKVFVLRSKFQRSCTLRGGDEQRFLLPSAFCPSSRRCFPPNKTFACYLF